MQFLKQLGPIRTLFLLMVLIVILAAPLALEETRTDTLYGFMTTIMIPSMVPMFFFLLPMDMTMCRAIQDGQTEEIRTRYGKIIKLELLLWILLIVVWIPFLMKISS